MARKDTVMNAEKLMEETMGGNDASHDAAHVFRVRDMALSLAEEEGLASFPDSMEIVELAALLHDIGDYKYVRDPSQEKMAENFLVAEGIDENKRVKILSIINGMGFKEEIGGLMNRELDLEFGVVQDADRLDAIGAIGIARCFTFGGSRNRVLHNPLLKPRSDLLGGGKLRKGTSSWKNFWKNFTKSGMGNLEQAQDLLTVCCHNVFLYRFVSTKASSMHKISSRILSSTAGFLLRSQKNQLSATEDVSLPARMKFTQMSLRNLSENSLPSSSFIFMNTGSRISGPLLQWHLQMPLRKVSPAAPIEGNQGQLRRLSWRRCRMSISGERPGGQQQWLSRWCPPAPAVTGGGRAQAVSPPSDAGTLLSGARGWPSSSAAATSHHRH
ncbi:hypothetical protein AKJ16_DCAP09263 [Drosera capensis]